MSKGMITKRPLIAEIAVATAAVLVVAHILYRLRFIAFIDRYLSVIIAVLLLYVPIAVLWKRKREIDFIDRGWRTFVSSCGVFVLTALIVFPLFFACAHFWQLWVMGYRGFQLAPFPSLDKVVVYQLLVVALPEEFYFRGYVQSGMNMLFRRRWRVLGATLGWGWVVTALIFAVAHTIITYRWWHFAIFFPALVFGYLREKTGSITAPILFHALSNILMNWFSRSYF